MKKIIVIFIIILTFFPLTAWQKTLARELPEESQANAYCVKGDKILDYYQKLDDKRNAAKYLNAAKYYYYQASRIDISNQNSLIGIARIALYQGKTRDAKNALMMALNFNEVNPRVSFYLGETFFEEGEYTQAIDFYTWAYSHGYRYDYMTNIKLGICYEKLDDVKKAKYHYKNALKAHPGSVTAQAKLGGLDVINTDYKKVNTVINPEIEEEIDSLDLQNLNMPNL